MGAAVATRIAVVACAIALVAAVVWALDRPASGLAGGNEVVAAGFVGDIRPGTAACDALARTSRRADHLLVTIGTYGRGPQPLQVSVDGRVGSVLRSYSDGVVAIPLPAAVRNGGDRACVRNLGGARVAIAGQPGPSGASFDGRPVDAKLSFQLASSEPRDWGSRADRIVDRVGDAPGAPLGGATGWIGLGLAALGLVAALGATWRYAR